MIELSKLFDAILIFSLTLLIAGLFLLLIKLSDYKPTMALILMAVAMIALIYMQIL